MWKPAKPNIDHTEKKQMTPSITEAGFFWTDAMKVSSSFFITVHVAGRDGRANEL